MYGCELDYKESWTLKNCELWCWRRFLGVPWTTRRSNQSILKEISPKVSLEQLMLKLKTPILWPPDAKNWLIWKDPDAGKDWKREEKGTTENEMVGWHHWFNGHESEHTMGVGDGQGGLVCCTPWGHKELDTTEWLNLSELNWGTRDQIANIHWIVEKARPIKKKKISSASLTVLKPLTVWVTRNCGKFLKRWKYQTT